MQEKSVISTNQFVWMLFSVITSFSTLQVPGILLYNTSRDSWLAIIIAWALDVLLAMVYAYMGLRFPGENCVQYSISILGRVFGRIVGMMFPVFFLLVASLLMRSLAGLISNYFLPRTPIGVVLAISYLLIAYGVRKGIEAIARTCEVLGPIYLLSFVTLFAFVVPDAEIHRLKPLLQEGVGPVFSGAALILSFIGICIIMGMYIPVCNRPENGFLAKFIAVTLGSLSLISIAVLSVGIFGAEQAGNMINPGVQLARIFKIGDFLERLEIIWFVVSIAAAIMTATNLIWAFCLGTSQVVQLRTYKPLVFPAVLIAFILSLTSFENIAETMNFIAYSYTFYAIFVQTGIELFLFIAALILKKRGSKQNPQSIDQ